MSDLSLASLLKISTFSRGIRLDGAAVEQLTEGGAYPLSLHEYATTGGVTFFAEGSVYINAPFDEWYCTDPEAVLTFDPTPQAFVVLFRGEELRVRTLPLPGYLREVDAAGRLVTEVAMSHGDRLRLSPIAGCSLDCAFCDMAGRTYNLRSAERLVAAMGVALADSRLPVSHVLLSGGTPTRRDFGYYDELCARVIEAAPVPVDVMMVPRPDVGWIDRLVEVGVSGFAINLEVYGDAAAASITRLKHRIGTDVFVRNLERAVELTGGHGRVRSLLLVGLEPMEDTLAGVEFVAKLGCDPVLSPFRPAPGTPLAARRPPSAEFQERLFLEARDIVERHGVKLGPRCVACQHNTLTIPDGSADYFTSWSEQPRPA